MRLALVKPIDDELIPSASTDDFDSNALLAQMSPPARADVEPFCDRITLTPGQRLFDQDGPPRYLYLPLSGAIDLLSTLPTGQALTVALVDFRGVAGLPPLGNASALPLEAVVALPGAAIRMRMEAFTRVRHDVDVAGIFYSYLYGLTIETIQGALCNTFHTVEQRCARWLLTLSDIAGSSFLITHDQLSTMLGVRRPSVTSEAVTFKDRGAISYRRGRMRILDRAALRQFACTCYQTLHECQSRVPMGGSHARSRNHVGTR